MSKKMIKPSVYFKALMARDDLMMTINGQVVKRKAIESTDTSWLFEVIDLELEHEYYWWVIDNADADKEVEIQEDASFLLQQKIHLDPPDRQECVTTDLVFRIFKVVPMTFEPGELEGKTSPEFTDDEIIELRKQASGGRFGAPGLRPWDDTLKFARVLLTSFARRK